MEKIINFASVDIMSISTEENLKLKNNSNHDNLIHQFIFNEIDEFSKDVIRNLANDHSESLFQSNNLSLISEQKEIERLIEETFRSQGIPITCVENPELISTVFKFEKPDSLLPDFKTKLSSVKQLGISESRASTSYLLNPYFFGYKLSIDIFLTSLYCGEICKDLTEGLILILMDKYGIEYMHLFKYVSGIANKYLIESRLRGDENDESFISGIKTISGIYSDDIFKRYIFNSGIILATRNLDNLNTLLKKD